MSEPVTPSPAESPSANGTAPDAITPPTVVVTILPTGQPQIKMSMTGPMARLLANWMLDQAKLMLLTQPTDAEKSALVKPNGQGINSLMRRMQGH